MIMSSKMDATLLKSVYLINKIRFIPGCILHIFNVLEQSYFGAECINIKNKIDQVYYFVLKANISHFINLNLKFDNFLHF
jgi:hypothetical protein